MRFLCADALDTCPMCCQVHSSQYSGMSQRGLMMPGYLRGFLPSVGAGSSLVGAVIVVAAILSGVIAFQGWPGMSGNASGAGSVELKGAPAPAAPASARPAAVRATRPAGA